MAAEITAVASLSFRKGGAMDGLSLEASFTFTGTARIKGEQLVGFAAAEPLILGEVPAGGWLLIHNTDATNFVSVRGAAGQTPLIQLYPGAFALFPLHTSATAPTVHANVANCKIEYLLLEA